MASRKPPAPKKLVSKPTPVVNEIAIPTFYDVVPFKIEEDKLMDDIVANASIEKACKEANDAGYFDNGDTGYIIEIRVIGTVKAKSSIETNLYNQPNNAASTL